MTFFLIKSNDNNQFLFHSAFHGTKVETLTLWVPDPKSKVF